jgi:hypothetical protein
MTAAMRTGLAISERALSTLAERSFRLSNLVDLSPFGATHKPRLSRLDIAVVGQESLSEHDARDVVRRGWHARLRMPGATPRIS